MTMAAKLRAPGWYRAALAIPIRKASGVEISATVVTASPSQTGW